MAARKKKVNKKTGKTTYSAWPVNGATHTSNETLKHFFKAPAIKENNNTPNPKFDEWFITLKSGTSTPLFNNVKVVYQVEEAGHHARSFEDAFINVNKQNIKENCTEMIGLKNRKQITEIESADIYELTNNIMDKKSDFAASVLYLALTHKDINWTTPTYIKEGLKWISQ